MGGGADRSEWCSTNDGVVSLTSLMKLEVFREKAKRNDTAGCFVWGGCMPGTANCVCAAGIMANGPRSKSGSALKNSEASLSLVSSSAEARVSDSGFTGF
jgi:hypothetical protein